MSKNRKRKKSPPRRKRNTQGTPISRVSEKVNEAEGKHLLKIALGVTAILLILMYFIFS